MFAVSFCFVECSLQKYSIRINTYTSEIKLDDGRPGERQQKVWCYHYCSSDMKKIQQKKEKTCSRSSYNLLACYSCFCLCVRTVSIHGASEPFARVYHLNWKYITIQYCIYWWAPNRLEHMNIEHVTLIIFSFHIRHTTAPTQKMTRPYTLSPSAPNSWECCVFVSIWCILKRMPFHANKLSLLQMRHAMHCDNLFVVCEIRVYICAPDLIHMQIEFSKFNWSLSLGPTGYKCICSGSNGERWSTAWNRAKMGKLIIQPSKWQRLPYRPCQKKNQKQ